MELTLNQAKGQGYEYYLYADEQFQGLHNLNEITESDLADLEEGIIELANKETFHPNGTDEESIIEMIAEHIEINNADNTGDDSGEVYYKLMKIDKSTLAPFMQAINEKLSEIHYYKSSGVKLVAKSRG